MCGIVGGVTNREITPLLLDGLKRLEYRGYDSSGLVVLTKNNSLNRARSVGKVNNLVENLKTRKNKIKGNIGIHILVGPHMASQLTIMHIRISLIKSSV